MTGTTQMWRVRRRGELRSFCFPWFRDGMWSLSQEMVQTWLHWLKICCRIMHSIFECWLSDCPYCLNINTFPGWFGLCPLVLSEMLPSQFARQLVAVAMPKKQQGCDCTKVVSLHFKQFSIAMPVGFAPSDTLLCPCAVPQARREYFWLQGIGGALWFHAKLCTHRLCTSLSVFPVHCSGFNSSHPSTGESLLFPESWWSDSVFCSLADLYLETGKKWISFELMDGSPLIRESFHPRELSFHLYESKLNIYFFPYQRQVSTVPLTESITWAKKKKL